MIELLKILMHLPLCAAAFIVAWRIAMWAYWYLDKEKNCPHVSYKSFREFYAVAPDKWKIRSDYLEYEGGRVELEKYSDLLKCRRFKKQLKKRGGALEKVRRQANLIRDVQNDIDKYRKDALDKMKMQTQPVQETKEEGPEEQRRYTVLYSQHIGAGEYQLNRVEMRGKSLSDAEKCFFNNFRNCVIIAIWEVKNE